MQQVLTSTTDPGTYSRLVLLLHMYTTFQNVSATRTLYVTWGGGSTVSCEHLHHMWSKLCLCMVTVWGSCWKSRGFYWCSPALHPQFGCSSVRGPSEEGWWRGGLPTALLHHVISCCCAQARTTTVYSRHTRNMYIQTYVRMHSKHWQTHFFKAGRQISESCIHSPTVSNTLYTYICNTPAVVQYIHVINILPLLQSQADSCNMAESPYLTYEIYNLLPMYEGP